MSGRSGARPSFGRTIVASAPDRKRVNPAPSGRGGGAKSMPSRHGAHAADPVAGEGGGAPPAALSAPCEARAGFEPFQRLGETFPGDGHCQVGRHDKNLIAIPGSSSARGLPFPSRFRAFSRRCGAIFDSPAVSKPLTLGGRGVGPGRRQVSARFDMSEPILSLFKGLEKLFWAIATATKIEWLAAALCIRRVPQTSGRASFSFIMARLGHWLAPKESDLRPGPPTPSPYESGRRMSPRADAQARKAPTHGFFHRQAVHRGSAQRRIADPPAAIIDRAIQRVHCRRHRELHSRIEKRRSLPDAFDLMTNHSADFHECTRFVPAPLVVTAALGG